MVGKDVLIHARDAQGNFVKLPTWWNWKHRDTVFFDDATLCGNPASHNQTRGKITGAWVVSLG
jgi:hypothetical protein